MKQEKNKDRETETEESEPENRSKARKQDKRSEKESEDNVYLNEVRPNEQHYPINRHLISNAEAMSYKVVP